MNRNHVPSVDHQVLLFRRTATHHAEAAYGVGLVRSTSLAGLLVLISLWIPAFGAEPAQAERAIDEYQAAMETKDRNVRLERFARSAQLFTQLIAGGNQQPPLRNADLYVNLGNAALQAEQLGPAIAAYRRALALVPQHAQARQNLDYTRSLLPEWIRRETASHWLDSLFFWRALISRGQLLVLGAGCFLAAAVLFAGGLARRQAVLRNLAAVPLLAWAILTTLLFFGHNADVSDNAVVTVETTVYAADSENAAPSLAKPLPSGAELSLLQQRDRWSEVRLPNGVSGWVPTRTIDVL